MQLQVKANDVLPGVLEPLSTEGPVASPDLFALLVELGRHTVVVVLVKVFLQVSCLRDDVLATGPVALGLMRPIPC